MDKFKGFTHKTFDFLRDPEPHKQWDSQNCDVNPRIAYAEWQQEWNKKYKEIYENELLNPLVSLAEQMETVISQIDPHIDFSMDNVLSRQYKRVTVHGLYYKQQPLKDKYSYPVYFFDLDADGYKFGVGFTTTDRMLMNNFLRKLFENKCIQEKIDSLALADFDIEAKIFNKKYRHFYVKKNGYMGEELFSSGFVNYLQSEFVSLKWLYNYIKENVEV